jgi:murein DD-endopeptidase MepM/ murein hydrolase activator NlpD
MSVAEQMGLAVVLGHEAYRDGIVTKNNYIETRRAVLAHTEMVIRMIGDGQELWLNQNLANDLNAYFNARGDMNSFNAYVGGNYDSGGDYWKLIYDKDGNGFLEYDGLADIYDEDGNFLVGAGTTARALQTALGKYLGVSMSDAGQMLLDAGFIEKGNSWVNNENIGKRISIGRANDTNTTDYIFAAHHIGYIQGAITSVLYTENDVASARNILLDETVKAGVNSRYSILKRAAIDFYLPEASMFGGATSTLTTDAGDPSDYPTNLHKGNDYAAARGTIFNTIFSGIVREISNPQSIFFDSEEAFTASRNLYTPDNNHQWYYTHHNERYDADGNRIYVKDQNLRGNGVIIEHGFNLNNNFLSMGFMTRSNHFDSVNVSAGQYLLAGTGIGATGNSGWSTGPHVDYNLYFRSETKNRIKNIYDLNDVTDDWNGDKYVNPLNLYKRFK